MILRVKTLSRHMSHEGIFGGGESFLAGVDIHPGERPSPSSANDRQFHVDMNAKARPSGDGDAGLHHGLHGHLPDEEKLARLQIDERRHDDFGSSANGAGSGVSDAGSGHDALSAARTAISAFVERGVDRSTILSVLQARADPNQQQPLDLDLLNQMITDELNRAAAAAAAAADKGTDDDPSCIDLPFGSPAVVPVGCRQTEETERRRAAVRDAFVHCWTNYELHAFGADEIKPVSGKPSSAYGGMGATLVDALDTLWLMGLRDEFARAVDWVAEHFDPVRDWNGSLFEVTIRYVGGFLSAFELSGEQALLMAAQRTADQLLPAFKTPSGIAYTTVNMKTGACSNPSWTGNKGVLSEFGSLALEWRALARLTDRPDYREPVDRIHRQLDRVSDETGNALLPTFFDVTTGRPSNSHVTLGARGDSYFEYLLKQWLQDRSGQQRSRELYDLAVTAIQRDLVQQTADGRLTWIAERNKGTLVHKMDELVCFVPGMLTLDEEPDHLPLAESLAHTCWQLFNQSQTGLAPEIAGFPADGSSGFTFQAPHNLLRPETVESLFYLWRRTHKQQYRDWAWRIFQSWQKHSQTTYGFSGLTNVNAVPPHHDNRMESFFLAETLKYLYLIFADESLVDLNQFVFNTEAHLFRRL